MRFPRVDAYDRSVETLTDPFAHVTDRWNRCAGTHLDNHDRLILVLGEETVKAHLLTAGPVGKPGIIAEHQDVWTGRLAAVAASRNMLGTHRIKVYRDRFIVVPDIVATRRKALQVMD